jgi:hypothetical protein
MTDCFIGVWNLDFHIKGKTQIENMKLRRMFRFDKEEVTAGWKNASRQDS